MKIYFEMSKKEMDCTREFLADCRDTINAAAGVITGKDETLGKEAVDFFNEEEVMKDGGKWGAISIDSRRGLTYELDINSRLVVKTIKVAQEFISGLGPVVTGFVSGISAMAKKAMLRFKEIGEEFTDDHDPESAEVAKAKIEKVETKEKEEVRHEHHVKHTDKAPTEEPSEDGDEE